MNSTHDSKRYVYLDYAATAPVRSCTLDAEMAFANEPYSHANPNSLHSQGRAAAHALNTARADIARCIGYGIRPQEVLFTSGGTESNNLAIFSIAEGVRAKNRKRTKVIISAIEHDSVLDLVGKLKGRGFTVSVLTPNKMGEITLERLEAELDDTVGLVSVMYANNETGVIQPIARLGETAHRAGAFMHTDAIQAFGRIPCDFAHVDAASIAAHKIGGPIGIGALVLRRQTAFIPEYFGGGQEFGKRPGTQDVHSAVGFAAACKYVMADLENTRAEVEKMANHVYTRLCEGSSKIVPTTTATATNKLPGIVSIMVKGLDSETMLLKLDERGFEVSAGSACSSDSLAPSHVLRAMSIPSNLAYGALRISFDERVSLTDLDDFCDCLLNIVG